MVPRRHIAWLLVTTTALSAQDAWSDSYRCGRKIIRSGDTAAQLLRVCGEPLHKDRGQETISVDGARQKVRVERWYYRQSRRSLEHVIMLHRGKVVAVDVGD